MVGTPRVGFRGLSCGVAKPRRVAPTEVSFSMRRTSPSMHASAAASVLRVTHLPGLSGGGGTRVRRAFRCTACGASATKTEPHREQESGTETYLDVARRPSRFNESCWGDPEITEVLLQTMRIQWAHGYPNTPKGFPRVTHGFHEYPAGMQAAAADRCFDVLPGDSLLDPFCGSGTSVTVGMTRGYAAVGVDVSPLATFVAAHRSWRPALGEVTIDLLRQVARHAVRNMETAAKELREEAADERHTESEEREKQTLAGDAATERGAGAVPRDWRPIQRALSTSLESSDISETARSAEQGVYGALWFVLSVALQRSQKGRGKKRPYKRQRQKQKSAEATSENEKESFATPGQLEAASQFALCVDEYCDRIGELLSVTPKATPSAVLINDDGTCCAVPKSRRRAVLPLTLVHVEARFR